ncbi:MAG: MFS transporter, partial [Nitrososphaerota archaeon]|nr:MFS transporter [Nitrososphaerota archaeon]
MASARPPSRTNDTRKALLLIVSLAPVFLAVGFLQVVISAWLPTVGFSPFQVGLLITAQGALAVVTSIPLGIVSDVYGRKAILVLATLAGSVGLMIYALTLDFAALIVASAVLGLAEGATVSVWNALLADLTDG